MGKAYVFTARAQIDRLLRRNPSRWFSVLDIQSYHGGHPWSRSTIARALAKSVTRWEVIRQCVKGTYYYRYRSDDRFTTKACDCYLACVVEGKGYIGGEDDCPVHGTEY